MMETAIEKFSRRKLQFSDMFTFLRFSDTSQRRLHSYEILFGEDIFAVENKYI